MLDAQDLNGVVVNEINSLAGGGGGGDGGGSTGSGNGGGGGRKNFGNRNFGGNNQVSDVFIFVLFIKTYLNTII